MAEESGPVLEQGHSFSYTIAASEKQACFLNTEMLIGANTLVQHHWPFVLVLVGMEFLHSSWYGAVLWICDENCW